MGIDLTNFDQSTFFRDHNISKYNKKQGNKTGTSIGKQSTKQ